MWVYTFSEDRAACSEGYTKCELAVLVGVSQAFLFCYLGFDLVQDAKSQSSVQEKHPAPIVRKRAFVLYDHTVSPTTRHLLYISCYQMYCMLYVSSVIYQTIQSVIDMPWMKGAIIHPDGLCLTCIRVCPVRALSHSFCPLIFNSTYVYFGHYWTLVGCERLARDPSIRACRLDTTVSPNFILLTNVFLIMYISIIYLFVSIRVMLRGPLIRNPGRSERSLMGYVCRIH